MKKSGIFSFSFFLFVGLMLGRWQSTKLVTPQPKQGVLNKWKNTLQDKATSQVTTIKSSAVLDANKMGKRTTRMMCVCKESDNKYFGLRNIVSILILLLFLKKNFLVWKLYNNKSRANSQDRAKSRTDQHRDRQLYEQGNFRYTVIEKVQTLH